MKENREEYMLMGGDFNGRIGERGARNWEEERGGKRKSKDKVENAEERRLIEWIEENGWEVLNRNKQRDEEGGWTYVGSRGETVIDYGIVNEEAWERVEELRIEERAESDHLEVALRKRRRREKTEKEKSGDRNKTVYFYFFGIAVLYSEKM
jgi:exonuclease III